MGLPASHPHVHLAMLASFGVPACVERIVQALAESIQAALANLENILL